MKAKGMHSLMSPPTNFLLLFTALYPDELFCNQRSNISMLDLLIFYTTRG
jgi:hypothetical protein